MGHGDFWVTLFTKNYTGVYDMYNAKKGDGYPCFDELFHDCGGFAGHQDIFNVDVVRTGLTTESTFSRLLKTGDPKDWVVSVDGNHLLCAYGDQVEGREKEREREGIDAHKRQQEVSLFFVLTS